MIELNGITKVYEGKEVVSHCNMKVKQGSIHGFLGPNGAGKTTIFKLIAGLIRPTQGTVTLFGMDMADHHDVLLDKVGSLIETPVFHEHLTAVENLKIHLAYMDKEEVMTIDEALVIVGLNHADRLPVSKFSLGMRQRLAIARAIIHKPSILILDEPINGLDPVGIREMRELFITLKEKYGMTLLISSHILNEIEMVADRVSVILNGRIIVETTIADLKERIGGNLEEFYFEAIKNPKAVVA